MLLVPLFCLDFDVSYDCTLLPVLKVIVIFN